MDAHNACHGDAAQLYQFSQAVCGKGDTRGLPGNGGPIADGNAHNRFVPREYFGAEIFHAHPGVNGRGGMVAVSGEPDGIGNPQSAKSGENLPAPSRSGSETQITAASSPPTARYRREYSGGSASKHYCLPFWIW